MRTITSAVVSVAVLTACSTNLKHTCSDPTGLACRSQSEIHEVVKSGQIELYQYGDPASSEVAERGAEVTSAGDGKAPAMQMIEAGDPLFIAPEPMRIWFAEFRDKDDDLHSESYVWIRVGRGTWRIGERVSR